MVLNSFDSKVFLYINYNSMQNLTYLITLYFRDTLISRFFDVAKFCMREN